MKIILRYLANIYFTLLSIMLWPFLSLFIIIIEGFKMIENENAGKALYLYIKSIWINNED